MTSPTFDPGFTTSGMTAIFSAEARVRAMCRAEGALAWALADAGLVDADVADRVAAMCAVEVPDAESVLADGWEVGTPVLALLGVLRDRLRPADRDALHHGATSQDVVDTGLMLQTRDGLGALRQDLVALATAARALAVQHRDTPTPGWTLLQPAVQTTAGLRVAGWLSPVVAHLAALREIRAGLPVQLGGATGTLDALGHAGVAVVEHLADRLGLGAPRLPWHTDRTPVSTVVGLLERLTRTVATIATDLTLLAHDGEARMRAGRSSSMPDKHNPIDAVRAIAAAEACAGIATVVTRGRPHELERAVGGWHAEWLAVPLAFHTAGAAVEAVGRAITSLELVTHDTGDGPTPATKVFVDRVVTACDAELAR